jgi:poly(hydroxyalkanoate) depolymerase family esterase
MRNLSDTIARLSAFRGLDSMASGAIGSDRLKTLDGFGSNPGHLGARMYVPANLPPSAPLVVVLHGCTQTSASYDHGAGWSELAEVHGFAVLYPEQRRSNNANLCFNWFVPEDIRRDSGEALSIRQMVASMIDVHGIDPARVFATGLSAGGAMTAVMLATYPDVFAGGAVIAGIPYGAATTMSGAFDRMRGGRSPDAAALGLLVRDASTYQGPWPTLSVWHGDADNTVDDSNATLLIDQWCALYQLPVEPSRTETVDGHPRKIWCDAGGTPVIEDFRIAGMGHGTPVDPLGADAGAGSGVAGPYMLNVGIASTRHIAAFWGLAKPSKAAEMQPWAKVEAVAAGELASLSGKPPVVKAAVKLLPIEPDVSNTPVASSVSKVIDDALRAAGLLR